MKRTIYLYLIFFIATCSTIFINAQTSLDRMMVSPQKLSLNNILLNNYKDSIAKYEALGMPAEALNHLKKYRIAYDSIMNEENLKVISNLNEKFESQKKENQIKLLLKSKLVKDKKITNQKIILNLVMGAIVLVVLLSLLLFGRYRIIRNLNKKLDYQNETVARKNRLIVDSIDYAQRIQQSIMPSSDYLKQYLDDVFIFYLPKEIVSGDLYWFREKNNKIWLAAIDCTGHGVPGAMMSMVAYDLLHQSVRLNKLEAPDEILKSMNKGVQNFSAALNENSEVKDGMDMAMCLIDKSTLQLNYSGAQNNIYIIRDKTITILNADKVSIGLPQYYDFNFTRHTFQLQKGDWIYMFTDGFADQKGAETGKKYFFEPFRQLLLSNSHLPGNVQQKNIQMAFNQWVGEKEPIDDILVFGIKI